jgi:hypothetical protein
MSQSETFAKISAFSAALIDQHAARILVEPQDRSTGYWFGGGNTIQDSDGSFLICGRYRNYGDSRTGTGAGERGLELAIFRSDSLDGEFQKVKSFSKADLVCNGLEIVSIEGCALHKMADGTIELFISTEKFAPYPAPFEDFLKPGAGVWSIDRIAAPTIDELDPSTIHEVIPFGPPEHLHCKDPVAKDLPNGDLALIYCNHPFTWSSSNTSLTIRKAGSDTYEHQTHNLMSHGPVWDIAATRVTDRLPLPQLNTAVYYYDSCESLRQLDENPTAVTRPRGFSCEEIGGIAAAPDSDTFALERVTVLAPAFISPYGTGCSRYIDTLVTDDGIFATWQQSQEDLSQPLVGHFLPNEKVDELLS